MHELSDDALEVVTAGKMPRRSTEEMLAAYRDLAKSLGRNGNQIGGAADKFGNLMDDIQRRLGPPPQ